MPPPNMCFNTKVVDRFDFVFGGYRIIGKENIPTPSTFQRQSLLCGLTGRSRQPLVMRNPLVEETRLDITVVKGQQHALGNNIAGCSPKVVVSATNIHRDITTPLTRSLRL
jgi:hypothetical protein